MMAICQKDIEANWKNPQWLKMEEYEYKNTFGSIEV